MKRKYRPPRCGNFIDSIANLIKAIKRKRHVRVTARRFTKDGNCNELDITYDDDI